MAADPGQRGASHRSCTQKSHRGGSSPVSCRSVENQNRPAPSTRAGLNQLKTSSRGTERRTLFEQINHFGTWALPVPNLLRKTFACVGLDWARPQVPLLPDRIDQMVLRQKAQVRIGVRAAGNKPTSK